MSLACCFCTEPVDESELMFRSEYGGAPPCICQTCVLLYAEVIDTYRKDPVLAASLVRALNRSVAEAREGVR